MVNDVFNDIIASMKSNQDAQSLQIIKEFYQREVSTLKGKNADISKLKEQVEIEKQKRLQSESKVLQLQLPKPSSPVKTKGDVRGSLVMKEDNSKTKVQTNVVKSEYPTKG